MPGWSGNARWSGAGESPRLNALPDTAQSWADEQVNRPLLANPDYPMRASQGRLRLFPAVFAALFALLQPGASSASEAGAISGRVTTEDGGTTRLCIHAWNRAANTVQGGEAAADGTYRIGDLAPGDYIVDYIDCGLSPLYLDEWYPGVPTEELATSVSVAAGSEVSGIDAVLERGGRIVGRMTDEHGTPLAFAYLEAEHLGAHRTDANGEFAVGPLRTGSYRLHFWCNDFCLAEYWPDKATLEEAEPIFVTQGQDVTGINAILQGAGVIEGDIRDAEGHLVFGTCVILWGQNGHYIAGGEYHWDNLPPGDYHVSFGRCDFPHLPPYVGFTTVWYPGTIDRDAAMPIHLEAHETHDNINGVVRAINGMIGRVLDQAGRPLEGACVTAMSSTLSVTARTYSSGHFAFKDLPPDQYRMRYEGCDAGLYLTKWHGDASSEETSTPIVIEPGFEVTGLTTQLTLGGAIIGTVNKQSGGSVENVCVDFFNSSDAIVATTRPAEFGRYRSPNMAADDYRIRFSACSGDGSVFTEWWEDASEAESAIPIAVTPGRLISEIDPEVTLCFPGWDADEDGLDHCEETRHGTRVNDGDTDGDLFGDGTEVKGGTCFGAVPVSGGSNPNDPTSTPLAQLPVGPTPPYPQEPIC